MVQPDFEPEKYFGYLDSEPAFLWSFGHISGGLKNLSISRTVDSNRVNPNVLDSHTLNLNFGKDRTRLGRRVRENLAKLENGQLGYISTFRVSGKT